MQRHTSEEKQIMEVEVERGLWWQRKGEKQTRQESAQGKRTHTATGLESKRVQIS